MRIRNTRHTEDTRLRRQRPDELTHDVTAERFAHVGDELRNRLAPIVSALELVRARVGPQVERELAIVDRHVEGAIRAVDQLLTPSSSFPHPRGAARHGEASTEKPVDGARVLVVDDNIDAAEILAESLSAFGYEPHVAFDGDSALRLAAAIRPSVAILDIGLPDTDGYVLGRRIRELDGLEGLRMIALTGYGQASHRERSAAAGFAAHLVKPASIHEVVQCIEAGSPAFRSA